MSDGIFWAAMWRVCRRAGDGGDGGGENYSDSYFAWDIADWDHRQVGRDKSLTIPVDQAQLLDGLIPKIPEIIEDPRNTTF